MFLTSSFVGGTAVIPVLCLKPIVLAMAPLKKQKTPENLKLLYVLLEISTLQYWYKAHGG